MTTEALILSLFLIWLGGYLAREGSFALGFLTITPVWGAILLKGLAG